jgi:uncharacterized protein YjiS (DUF1127 family)
VAARCLMAEEHSASQCEENSRLKWTRGGVGGWLYACRTTLVLWWRRKRQREELSRMTEAEQRDAGISASDARYEIRKPFWRA